MTALIVTESCHVPALGEQNHAYPLVPGQRLEGLERRGIVWHAKRLVRGEPVEPVLVVPRVLVREEEPVRQDTVPRQTTDSRPVEGWRKGPETCPRCGRHTDEKIVLGGDGHTTYMVAERCRPCGLMIDLGMDDEYE